MQQPASAAAVQTDAKHAHIWRARFIAAAFVIAAMAVYFSTVVWVGHGLADDMRQGIREVKIGALIPDMEG